VIDPPKVFITQARLEELIAAEKRLNQCVWEMEICPLHKGLIFDCPAHPVELIGLAEILANLPPR